MRTGNDTNSQTIKKKETVEGHHYLRTESKYLFFLNNTIMPPFSLQTHLPSFQQINIFRNFSIRSYPNHLNESELILLKNTFHWKIECADSYMNLFFLLVYFFSVNTSIIPRSFTQAGIKYFSEVGNHLSFF